ncbi:MULTISPECIES: hypothetical protein [unclassified Kitasatospora]|uniref:hypothetical protein n=1 Tax=unclassified Kitasatospora TaxID=2633591 RepID=UPI00340ADD5E
MTNEEYDAWQAGLEQMHRDYEAADQAEYVAWLDELDAPGPAGRSGGGAVSSQHLGDAELARRMESIRQAAEAAERARQQADQLRQQQAGGR